MTTTARRVRIYRAQPGLWIIIDRDYATYSTSTWRAAMDSVYPPSRYCGKGVCAYMEGHEGRCGT